MRKSALLILIVLLSVSSNMAQSGEKVNPSESGIHRELSGGFVWHPRGLGINVKSTSRKAGNRWRVLDFDLVSMRHIKERRIRSASFSAPGSYFYGKLNATYFLRAGFGYRWDLSSKLYNNTVAAKFQVSAGPTLAFLKPVYLEIYYPTPDNQAGFLVSERYDPQKHTDQTVIFGNSSFFRGLGETRVRAGLNLKANVQFDWSDYSDQIQSVEMGAALDFYGREIPIMAFAQNKKVFTSLYICLNIGNRW